jgi:hypothetical protein
MALRELGWAAGLLAAATPAAAQQSQPGNASSVDSSDTTVLAPDLPDPAAVQMPDLGSNPSPGAGGSSEKYYFFHRSDTRFASAFADLRECDDFARGVVTLPTPAGSPYGDALYPKADASGGAMANASFGNASASVLGDALLSEDARNARRTDIRRCMHYKGYRRFGIEKTLWQKFNFEEGNTSIGEADRQRLLAQQAKVASSAGIEREDLGL